MKHKSWYYYYKKNTLIFYDQCWEGYFGNVSLHRLQVTLFYIYIAFNDFSKCLMFSTNPFETCKAGRVHLTVY